MQSHGYPFSDSFILPAAKFEHLQDDEPIKKLATFKIICLCLIVTTSCQKQIGSVDAEFQVPVKVTKVGVATLESRIVTGGALRATKLATLSVKTAGLLQIAEGENGQLREGDHVRAGDILASVIGDDVRLAIKRAAVKQRLDTAVSNLAAAETLFAKHIISVAQHNHLKVLLEEAKLEYDKSLNIESQTDIRTPIGGVILSLCRDENGQRMANGQWVELSQEIARVAPLDPLIADVQLVSSDIARVHKGLSARISTHVWEGEEFDGEVVRLAPVVDEKTRTLEAQVSVDNRNGMLKPGMYVEVTLVVERRESVPTVPTLAVTERGGRKVVFVRKGPRVEQREVSLGIRQGDQVEVLTGVEVGESVVVLGIETLADQMPVQVIST